MEAHGARRRCWSGNSWNWSDGHRSRPEHWNCRLRFSWNAARAQAPWVRRVRKQGLQEAVPAPARWAPKQERQEPRVLQVRRAPLLTRAARPARPGQPLQERRQLPRARRRQAPARLGRGSVGGSPGTTVYYRWSSNFAGCSRRKHLNSRYNGNNGNHSRVPRARLQHRHRCRC